MDFASWINSLSLFPADPNPLIVLGNESVDLDSFCGSIAYAFYKSIILEKIVCPVVYSDRSLLDIKREILKIINDFNLKNLIFYKQVVQISRVILVDHNDCRLRLESSFSVEEIIDHHTDMNNSGKISKKVIEKCASNSSLLAREIKDHLKNHRNAYLVNISNNLQIIAKLLIVPIVVDSHKLRDATEIDLESAHWLLEVLREDKSYLNSVYEQFHGLLNDDSRLLPSEALRKDFKRYDEKLVYGISSVKLNLKEFVHKNENEIFVFIKNLKIEFLLIMSVFKGNRELAFVVNQDFKYLPKIRDFFGDQRLDLALSESRCSEYLFLYSPTRNKEYTRKYLQPILSAYLKDPQAQARGDQTLP